MCLLSLCLFAASAVAQSERDLGIQAYRDHDYQKAAKVLGRYVEIHSKDSTAWRYLGGAFTYLNDEKNARKAFLKSDGGPPKDIPALTYDSSYEIISAPRPRLSDETRNRSRGANIRVLIELRDDGRVGFVYPFPNFESSFERDVLDAAKVIRFKPAIKDGKPVTVIITREYSFWTS
jgi:hypothetical protein